MTPRWIRILSCLVFFVSTSEKFLFGQNATPSVITTEKTSSPSPQKDQGLQKIDPKVMKLLEAYEKTLAPYQRMKATWKVHFDLSLSDEKIEKPPKNLELTVLRDKDRVRFIVGMDDSGKGEFQWYSESICQRGKNWVQAFLAPPSAADQKSANQFHIMGKLQITEDEFLRYGGLGISPSSGAIDDIWIPDFLHTSVLSVEHDTWDKDAYDVLQGKSQDTEIKLWLDVARGYAVKKISCNKRISKYCSQNATFVNEVKRFEEKGGVMVPVEFVLSSKIPAEPVMSPVADDEKGIDGKAVPEFQPARDEKGEIIMSPAHASSMTVTLTAIDFQPKFTDQDFKITKPIPDGVPVSVFDAPFVERVSYQWLHGEIVRVVESAVKGKFDPKDDVKAKIAKRLKIAKRANEYVLVMFGNNAWQECSALEEPFQSGLKTLWPLLEKYQVVYADSTVPANRTLATEYGLTLDDQKSVYWILLDGDGRAVCRQSTAVFSRDGRYDADKIASFLQKWTIPPENAEDLLRAALQKAARDRKKVFVVLTGTLCGPCHRLLDFLEQRQDVLSQDYVIAAINMDRTTHVKEVVQQVGYPSDPMTGVPWWAILSPEGKPLVTSNGPKGNIGFPSKNEEIEHFLKMLRQTSTHISAEQFKAMEKSLMSVK